MQGKNLLLENKVYENKIPDLNYNFFNPKLPTLNYLHVFLFGEVTLSVQIK